ncbi:hypothetical protein M434DRAFT_22024 [Hypoxylon sp. CO27-5]|nr:hypothetical protein M434DRAFT_22024 [Hypoxylon sp. CO27-5]
MSALRAPLEAHHGVVLYLSAGYLVVGLPIRIIPISHTNPLWMLVDRQFISFIKRFPFGHNSFTRYNYRAWEVADRYWSHHEIGDAFDVVRPGRNWLYIANPDTIVEVFRRRTDFPRCLELTGVLNVFGPNISTVDGPQWKTQRKMTATCFNDQNNEIVWSKTLGLANDMAHYWSSKPSVRTIAHDARTLSLHVLSKAGFGKSFKFEGHDERLESSLSASYKDSLQMILENYNLMSSLVRASQDEAKTSVGLTENEIYGNMFVFNFAGHDTTAHTFTFAIYFLAANPQVQDWVYEELCRVLGDRRPNDWNYSTDFPRLKRCLSVMLETVRLYTPVPVAKWTETQTQSLNAGTKTVILPPDTMVIPSYASVQTDPKGSQILGWIKTTNAEDEDLITPQHGTFLGWSEGARDCPGWKFSHVEFVGTMAVLFRNWRVDPVTQPGESIEAARKRVLRLIETDSSPVLLLQMLHPERAPLVWKRR